MSDQESCRQARISKETWNKKTDDDKERSGGHPQPRPSPSIPTAQLPFGPRMKLSQTSRIRRVPQVRSGGSRTQPSLCHNKAQRKASDFYSSTEPVHKPTNSHLLALSSKSRIESGLAKPYSKPFLVDALSSIKSRRFGLQLVSQKSWFPEITRMCLYLPLASQRLHYSAK